MSVPTLSRSQRNAAIALGVLYMGWFLFAPAIIVAIPWDEIFPNNFLVVLLPILILASAIPAIIGLAALWCVWGPVRLLTRCGIVAGASAVLMFAWFFGLLAAIVMAAAPWNSAAAWEFFVGHIVFLLAMPGIITAAALPPLLARLLVGLRLSLHGQDCLAVQGNRFSLGSLMGITLLVAVSLGAARQTMTLTEQRPDGEGMLALALVWAVSAGVSLLSTVPAALLILWPRSWQVCLILLPYGLIVSFLAILLLGPPGDGALFFGLMLLVFTIALVLPLMYARWIGYRLRRGSAVQDESAIASR